MVAANNSDKKACSKIVLNSIESVPFYSLEGVVYWKHSNFIVYKRGGLMPEAESTYSWVSYLICKKIGNALFVFAYSTFKAPGTLSMSIIVAVPGFPNRIVSKRQIALPMFLK
ncbi:hypothetical protein S225a_23090 [Candidatus Brocadiaceae bacterium S225]|nr:hypothetical protein S225a_23090 [Candidatus Brocadiaceae bacterium S225]